MKKKREVTREKGGMGSISTQKCSKIRRQWRDLGFFFRHIICAFGFDISDKIEGNLKLQLA